MSIWGDDTKNIPNLLPVGIKLLILVIAISIPAGLLYMACVGAVSVANWLCAQGLYKPAFYGGTAVLVFLFVMIVRKA